MQTLANLLERSVGLRSRVESPPLPRDPLIIDSIYRISLNVAAPAATIPRLSHPGVLTDSNGDIVEPDYDARRRRRWQIQVNDRRQLDLRKQFESTVALTPVHGG